MAKQIQAILAGLFLVLSTGCGFEDLGDKLGATKEEEKTSRGGGADATANPGFRLTIDQYDSCGELQSDIRSRLLARQSHDRSVQAYHERMREKRKDKKSVKDVIWGPGGVGGGSDGADVDWNQSGPLSDRGDFDEDDASMGEAAPNGGSQDILTNNQTEGVDEADITKVGTHHFFVLKGNAVEVADRATLKLMGRIELPALSETRLYTEGDHLFVVGNRSGTKTICTEVEAQSVVSGIDVGKTQQCRNVTIQTTEIHAFNAPAGALPTLAHTRELRGLHYDSRMTQGRLYLVMRAHLPVKQAPWNQPNPGCGFGDCEMPNNVAVGVDVDDFDEDDFGLTQDVGTTDFAHYQPFHYNYGVDTEIPAEPVILDSEGGVAGLPCTAIAKPIVKDLNFGLTFVYSIDPRQAEEPAKGAAVIGGGEQIYMGPDSLYITRQGINWPFWVAPDAEPEVRQEKQQSWQANSELLAITKVSLNKDTGDLAITAAGKVYGRVLNQFAFNEYTEAGALAVATTTNRALTTDGPKGQQNHLWVLQAQGTELKTMASVLGFGQDESIHSVRYVNKMAYVVTFRQIDPLFAFDMTNPLSPMMVGELKIPGFSAYMHPLNDQRLVGVGYDNGIQVSLFDVADPTAMSRLDVQIIGHNGAQTEVAQDHKAFFMDPSRALVGVPTNLNRNWYKGGSGSGAKFYKIENDKLVEQATISHRSFQGLGCGYTQGRDVRRIFLVDNRIITVSDIGIQANDPDDLSKVLGQAQFGAAASTGAPIEPGVPFKDDCYIYDINGIDIDDDLQ